MTIELRVDFDCDVGELFQYLINKKLLSKWLIEDENNSIVQPRKNGKYWLFISETHNTEGCRILSIKINSEIEFNWKGPEEFDDFLNFSTDLTTVKIFFQILETGKSNINLQHFGWRSSEDYQKARIWHTEFWKDNLDKLKKAIEN